MTVQTGPFYEQVEIGAELPILVKTISIPQLAMYAAVCWDFQPVHYDSGSAQAGGFRTAFVDGPMVTAFLTQIVSRWMGASGKLKRLSVTYRVMMFPGDTLTCKGKITGKSDGPDKGFVDCDVWAENQRGEKAVYGAARVELPLR